MPPVAMTVSRAWMKRELLSLVLAWMPAQAPFAVRISVITVYSMISTLGSAAVRSWSTVVMALPVISS